MENPGKHEVKPGLNRKKIVVTTHKLYVFRTLANDIEEIEFRLQNKKPQLPLAVDDKADKQFTSVTGEPQNEIDIQQKYGKVVLEEEPSIHEFIKKLNIFTSHRPVKNSVLLLSPLNRTIEMVFFERLKEAFRFAKAINCANAWMRYAEQCQVKKVRPNYRWTGFLQQIIYNEDALVVVDPLDFNDQNQEEEMTCFIELLERAAYINRLQLKFKIKSDYGYFCANKFLNVSVLNGLRVLQLSDCSLSDNGLEQLESSLLKLSSLTEVNLTHNNLSDNCLTVLTKMFVQCQQLSRLKLQKNNLQLAKQNHQMLLVDLLRSSLQMLYLDISENKLEDSAIQVIERAVIFAQNPPLREIDLSTNLFSKYGSWRLFKGNLIMMKNHEYLLFILYPIPFNLEIFTEGFEEFPFKRQPMIKPAGNLPLSLSQELLEETNTLTSLTLNQQNSTGLVIRRKIHSGKPLPKSYNDVASMTQIKGKLSKLIADKNTKLEDILKQCGEIEQQKFGYPSSVLEQITYYLWQKLNEALLIRDHESISMLKRAATMINVDLNPYRQRLLKVEKRKDIYSTKLRQIYNFEINQFDINRELDEMVKEGLRISLKGKALNFLFYLKDLRDKKIRQLIDLNYNPIMELEELKTRNYATFYDVSADGNIEWEVPYELQQQKDINENLYLFHLQADYDVLARLDPHQYQRIEGHLRSVKLIHEKFIKYLRLAEERLKFIINEYYQTFSFNTFKISFVELKINACRHLWHYRNIRRTMEFFGLPAYTRKMPVSPEKCIVIGNKQEFCHRYAIDNYPNIREEVWRAGVYGYRSSLTKYCGVDFQNECKELCNLTDSFLRILTTSKDRITEQILPSVFKIARHVQNALYPEELLEEFYLHLICMQEENNKNTELLIGLIPFLTMYLKPPQTIEKTLLAFLARNDFSFSYMPMSMEYESDIEMSLDRVFVERDWTPKDKYAMQLINRYGKITIKLNTPLRTSFTLELSEVENVGDMMYQVYLNQYLSPFYDKYSFWVFKINTKTHEESTFDCQDLIGEIINEMNEEQEMLIIKRRVFSPYYIINLRDYSPELLTSIYYEIKYYYLQQMAYRAYDQEIEIASIFAFIAIFDPPFRKSSGIDPHTEFKIYVDNLDRYLEDLFPKYFLAQRDRKEIIRPLKNRLNERLARQEEKAPLILKRKIIDKFRDQPYYCSSNYTLYSENHGTPCLLSINSMFLCVQFDLDFHYIFLESIVNFTPYERHIMLRYYDKDRGQIEELSFATRDKQSMWVVMDFLSYCIIRIKTPNMFLYLQREMYAQLIKYSLPMTIFDYEVQMNTSIVAKKISIAREELSQSTVDELVNLFQKNLKRLEKLEIVIETGREYIFQRENLFVKTYINRLQYPYRVGKKLEMSEPLGPRPKKAGGDKEPQNVLKSENKPAVMDNPFAQFINDELEPEEEPQETASKMPPPQAPTPKSQQPTAQKPTVPPPAPPQPPSEQPPFPDDGEIIVNRASRTGARDSRARNSRDRDRRR